MSDDTTYDALFDAVAAVPLSRGVLIAEGPEAASYLHGQLTQDVEGLPVGASAWSFLLEPTGKLESHLRITRVADDRFVLDTEPELLEATRASLERFKLRTKVEFESAVWEGLGLRGPGHADVVVDDGVVDVPVTWPGGARDVLGPDGVRADVPLVTGGLAEVARIEAGMPRLGVDFEPGAIPQETGWVPASVSFTKGCYRGQELVERISARGAERRVMRRFRVEGQVSAGEHLHVDGAEIGVLTSTGDSPRSGTVALGWVRGAVEEGSAASAPGDARVIVCSRVDEE